MDTGASVGKDGRTGLSERDTSLTALIQRLKEAKFSIGTSEAIDAGRLLRRLADRNDVQPSVEMLRARLRPVFCKHPEEQLRFDKIFEEWALGAGFSGQSDETHRTSTDASALPGPNARTQERPTWRARTRWALYGVLFITLGIAATAAVWTSKTTLQHAPTQRGGRMSYQSESPVHMPHPVARQTSQTQQPTLDFFPAVRRNREIEAWMVWTTLGAGLSLLLVCGLPAQFISATAGSRSGRKVVLDTRPLDAEARRIVPQIASATASRLLRHIRAAPEVEQIPGRRRPIDIRRTVDATALNLGILALRYRQVSLRPSYLVLIDATDEHDPRGRLFYRWAERLDREVVDVDIRLFRPAADNAPDTAPQVYRTTARPRRESARATSGLDKLGDPPEDQRLIVIGDGACFTDSSGRPHAWVRRARFFRWRNRVLFTPVEYRDWGEREVALERPETPRDPGFLVMPLDEEALAAWSTLLVSGALPMFGLSELERFPRLLTTGSWDPMSNSPPPQLSALMAQLRLYLGDNGFRWLTACAVVPTVRWEITLLLGEQLFGRMGLKSDPVMRQLMSANYRRLVRLPWLRAKHFPDWLRLALLTELPRHVDDQMRTLVRGVLDKVRQVGNEGLPIELEPPPGFPARLTPRADSSRGDILYLGYMSGLSPRQLQLRAPASWSGWIGRVQALAAKRGNWFADALDTLGARIVAMLARLVFRKGMPFAGPARGGLIAGGLAIVLWLGGLAWLSFGKGVLHDRAVASLPTVATTRWVAFTHKGPVLDLDLSADGQFIVTGGEDRMARVWNARTGALVRELAHRAAVVSVKFSPDRRIVASVSVDHKARIWNALASGAAPTIERSVDDVNSVAFSPDGSKLIITFGSSDAHVVDARTGHLITELQGTLASEDATFSPDGVHLAVLLASGRVQVLNGISATGLRPPPQFGLSASFSPDGHFLAIADVDGAVKVMTADTSNVRFFAVGAALSDPMDVDTDDSRNNVVPQISSDLKLAYSPRLGSVRVVSIPNGTELATFELPLPATILRFNPAGTLLLVGTTTGKALLYDLPSGSPKSLIGHTNSVVAARFTAAGSAVLTGSLDGTARRWETPTSDVVLSDPGQSVGAGLNNFEVSPDGRYVLTLDKPAGVRSWDASTGKLLGRYNSPVDIPSLAVAAFSPEGSTVAIGAQGNRVLLLGLPTLSPRNLPNRPLLAGDRSPTELLRFDPTGHRLLAIGDAGDFGQWDLATGRFQTGPPMTSQPGKSLLFGEVRWRYDGQTETFFRYDDSTIEQWKVWLRSGPTIVRGKFAGVTKVDASPDGATLFAIAGRNASLWDSRKGIGISQPKAIYGPFVDFAYSPDGRRIATVGKDQAVELFDARTGQWLLTARYVGNAVSIRFTNGDDTVVTTGQDGRAQVWRIVDNSLVWSSSHIELTPELVPNGDGTATLIRPAMRKPPSTDDQPTIAGAGWYQAALGWFLCSLAGGLLLIAIATRGFATRRRLVALGRVAEPRIAVHASLSP